jgi:hypothetical protein
MNLPQIGGCQCGKIRYESVRRREDDHGAARPTHPSLRYRRDRQRELAPQEPPLIPLLESALREGSLLHADPGSRFSAD